MFQRRYRNSIRLFACLFLIGFVVTAGCARRTLKPPSERPIGKPLLDTRRGAVSFPLRPTTLPSDTAGLADSLRDGYARSLELSDDASIKIKGEKLGELDHILIDVTGSKVKEDFKPKGLRKDAGFVGATRARVIRYQAWPLILDGAKAHGTVEAHNADLHVLRDKKNTTALTLHGADSGRFSVRLSEAEFKKFIMAGAKRGVRKYGVTVRSVEMKLATPTPHRLLVDVEFKAIWVLVPVSLKLKGVADINTDLMVLSLSDLSVEGMDPGRSLAAAFIEPQVYKFAEKRRPLVMFGDGQTRVTSVMMDASDGIRFEAIFARPATGTFQPRLRKLR